MSLWHQSCAVVLLVFVSTVKAAVGADEFQELRTISKLPASSLELQLAHSRSAGDACEPIAAGEAVELASFLSALTDRDRTEQRGNRLPATARQSIFSIGLTIDTRDQADLPKLSKGTILDYLEKNYVSVQVRVRRDLLDRKLYFHHRPIAVTALYRGSKLSQKFEPVVANSVRDFHSLGLFRKETGRAKPEHFRTLVLLFKNKTLNSGSRTTDRYEFAFIRGRESSSETKLDTHVFVTTKDRSELTYLNPYAIPNSFNVCSIRGVIAITDFDSSGIYPKDSATRSFRLASRKTVTLEQVDAYCEAANLKGGFNENVAEVLDAMIDGKIVASGSESLRN